MNRWHYYIWNFWPPFWGAGIKIDSISRDMFHIRILLKKRPWTRNYVGTQFGGSIYAMVDPFYMVMLLYHLGRDYIIWDKAAQIRFRKPGRTALVADFRLNEDDIKEIRKRLETEEKIDWERDVLVKDLNGETIAEVRKVIYIRRK